MSLRRATCFDFERTNAEMHSEKSNNDGKKKLGLIAVGVTGAVAIGLSVISAPFVTPALRKVCLPYVPATSKQIGNVIKMCNTHRKSSKIADRLIDLGSGDGRIVFEAAKNGYQAVGVELNVWLVIYSKIAARFKGIHHKAQFQRKNLWTVDLSLYDKVVIFGVSEMMPALKDKLEKEMKIGSKIIACRFPMPSWTPVESIDEGIDSVWVYDVAQITDKPTNES